MKKSVTVKARGKVNLSLNIVGTRDNMHVLDSIVAPVDVFDIVTVDFTTDARVRVRFAPLAQNDGVKLHGLDAIPVDNTAAKAVRFLQSFCPDLGADVTVQKGIPLAGGLGGSSVDAAAVLTAAAWAGLSLPADCVQQSVRLGSDVPALCMGGCVRMSGIGDSVEKVTAQALHLVIACGGAGVSSREAYALFDKLYPQKAYCPTDTNALLAALRSGTAAQIAPQLHNALQKPSERLCPDIATTLRAVSSTGAMASWLTGSGNCCCGLFATAQAAQVAAKELRASGLWAVATQTCRETVQSI